MTAEAVKTSNEDNEMLGDKNAKAVRIDIENYRKLVQSYITVVGEAFTRLN